jgi:hypothetical protein
MSVRIWVRSDPVLPLHGYYVDPLLIQNALEFRARKDLGAIPSGIQCQVCKIGSQSLSVRYCGETPYWAIGPTTAQSSLCIGIREIFLHPAQLYYQLDA